MKKKTLRQDNWWSQNCKRICKVWKRNQNWYEEGKPALRKKSLCASDNITWSFSLFLLNSDWVIFIRLSLSKVHSKICQQPAATHCWFLRRRLRLRTSFKMSGDSGWFRKGEKIELSMPHGESRKNNHISIFFSYFVLFDRNVYHCGRILGWLRIKSFLFLFSSQNLSLKCDYTKMNVQVELNLYDLNYLIISNNGIDEI